MKQKAAYEEAEHGFQLESSKELSPTLNKRFSLNLPDCSAVLDSQNNNLMDTNEISWLEKFAEENEKVCNSRLFDEGPPSPRPAPSNDMKFSFNMNYQLEDRRKEDVGAQDRQPSPLLAREYSSKRITRGEDTQNILADIQNTQTGAKRARKESLAGSIKKNQKQKVPIPEISEYHREIAENLPYSKLQEMNERLSKVLHHDRSSRIEQITNKQNAKLYSEISMGSLLPSATSKFQNTLQEHRRARDIPTIPALEVKVSPMKAAEPTPRSEQISALEALFERLDKSQTGKLSKFNCATEAIPEDFKFIFGGVFSSIRLKQYTCNKRQFVNSCEKVIRQLDSSEAVEMLKTFAEKEKSSLRGQKKFDGRSKSPFKATFFEEKITSNSYKQCIQSNSIRQEKFYNKITEDICKCGSKIDGKVDDNTNDSSRIYKQSAVNTRKYSEVLPASITKQQFFDENLSFCPKKPLQKDSYEHSQSQFHEDSSRKRGSSISESVIQDHKKSLQNLKKLNQRMEFCLSTNLLAEHSKPGLSRQDSLSFDELIKHV